MLSEKSTLVRFQEGDVIMRQGSPGESMYIVHSGVVTIFVRHNVAANTTSLYGEEVNSKP